MAMDFLVTKAIVSFVKKDANRTILIMSVSKFKKFTINTTKENLMKEIGGNDYGRNR